MKRDNKDLYAILHVSRGVSDAELKKAYRRLAMRFHPDRHPNDRLAEEKFKEISAAYAVLSNPKTRSLYDAGKDPVPRPAPTGRPTRPQPPPHKEPPRPSSSQDPSTEPTDPGVSDSKSGPQEPRSFEDLFTDVFGDVFKGAQAKRKRKKGADLRYTLTLSLSELAHGCEKTISYIRLRKGQEETVRLSVKVPAGIRPGQRLKLKGEGDTLEVDSDPGDLFVIIQAQEHDLFQRDADSVILELPLAYFDAMLGAQVEIPTLTGRASLKIPPGTVGGRIFRLRGKGFKKPDGTQGDMLVKAVIDVPNQISHEEVAVLNQLKRISPVTPLVKEFMARMSHRGEQV